MLTNLTLLNILTNRYEPLKRRIEEEQEAIWKKVPGKDISTYGPLLVLIKPDKLAVLVSGGGWRG
ncbi:unnamed protein product [Discosporangium mesarthrocarpum]